MTATWIDKPNLLALRYITKNAKDGISKKKTVMKSQTFPKVISDAIARITIQGGENSAEPIPTICQDSIYFEIKSIAPLGEAGSAPPLIEPNLFLEAINEIKKVAARPNSKGRLRRVCQFDLRDFKTMSSSKFSSITPMSA